MSERTKEFSKILKQLLNDKQMSQRDLAKELYITDSTMSYYLSGKALPSYEVMIQIAEFFNVSMDYLFHIEKIDFGIKKETNTSETINVPVFRDLKYNDSIAADSPNIEFIFPVNAERYKDCNRLFAKIVTTDEMYPRIMIGDIIIFEELKLGTDKIFNGDICLVSKGDDFVKIREMANTNDGYVFNPFNVDMPPRVYDMDRIRKENVHIIARAVKLIHEFKKRG